jgi:ParB-like chromosome segregation protein Spo0J
LFQPRRTTEDERHVQELARAVRNVGELDPLLVMCVGRHPYLIDGHHRLAAYQVAGITMPVPVEYFQGTVEEAVLAAGRENSKAKLPMRAQDRQDFAWKLTLLGSATYSKRQTMEAAGVSDGQVAIMRRAMKALGSEAYECRSWGEAHQRWQGLDWHEWSEEERETWKEERAAVLADKIAKACGPKFTEDTEIAAMTLERLFGRRFGDLIADLRGRLPDEEEDAEEDL